mgnify:CR=1 FL=1
MSEIWLALAVASAFFAVVLVGLAIESGSSERKRALRLLESQVEVVGDDALGLDRGAPRLFELLGELVEESKTRGILLVEVAGGWTMRSNPRYASYVQKHLALRPVRLSRAQLETLAIVAYRQPITRPEVDEIRGVDSGQVLKGLLERDLVKILGKRDEAGRHVLAGRVDDRVVFEPMSVRTLTEVDQQDHVCWVATNDVGARGIGVSGASSSPSRISPTGGCGRSGCTRAPRPSSTPARRIGTRSASSSPRCASPCSATATCGRRSTRCG